MKINKLDFSQYLNQPHEWKTKDLSFGKINLIVGKNATGKSRTLNVINSLAKILTNPKLNIRDGNWEVEFSDGTDLLKYELQLRENIVSHEKLTIGDDVRLVRESSGEGEIYYSDKEEKLRFKIAENKVAALFKRDEFQHGFLDALYNWGTNTLHYQFGSSLGRDKITIFDEDTDEGNIDLKKTDNTVGILRSGLSIFGDEYKQTIIEDMALIGYEIEDIGFSTPSGMTIHIEGPIPVSLPSMPMGVDVKEKDLDASTGQTEISQGMFRALSIIIQLNYGLLEDYPKCILIDDIGEGLDYERSSSLISLLIEKAQNSSIQLIMATNDRFVMNKIPIEYWIILQREGSKCTSFNYRNSKEVFDKFELTGLNNFDLLSSNYFLTGELGE
jgi:energy-coupling factor transporter ATP-binding protein EcfA2